MPTESAVPLFPSNYETVQKFGRHPNMAAADTNEEIWDDGSAYTYMSAATTLTVSSASANDISSTGTGARTVRVFGLNSDYQEVSQDVNMNGQSGVTLPTALIRVYRAYVLTAGSNDTNVGNIWVGEGSITGGVPATKYAGILANNGQTLMAIYTIPASDSSGTTYAFGRVIRWYASIAAAASARAELALKVREFGGAWRIRRFLGVAEGGPVDEMLTWGIDVAPKSDISIVAITNGVNSSIIDAGFDVALAY